MADSWLDRLVRGRRRKKATPKGRGKKPARRHIRRKATRNQRRSIINKTRVVRTQVRRLPEKRKPEKRKSTFKFDLNFRMPFSPRKKQGDKKPSPAPRKVIVTRQKPNVARAEGGPLSRWIASYMENRKKVQKKQVKRAAGSKPKLSPWIFGKGVPKTKEEKRNDNSQKLSGQAERVGPLTAWLQRTFRKKQGLEPKEKNLHTIDGNQNQNIEVVRPSDEPVVHKSSESFRMEPMVHRVEAAGTKAMPNSGAPKCTKFIVSEVMTRRLISLEPADTLEKAAEVFMKHGVSGAPVLEKGFFVGEVSRTDVLKVIHKENLETMDFDDRSDLREKRVADIMKKPICVFDNTPLEEARQTMEERKVHRLLVMNKENKLVGILTKTDLEKSEAREQIGDTVFTKIDEMLGQLEGGPMELGKLAAALGAQETLVEEWAKILEEHYLVEINYPPIGNPVVKLRTAKEGDVEG
jgi:CBS domain-containing protein